MNGIGNCIAVAVEALQDDLDVVDVFWRATMEAASWSIQAQGGT
jgi:hypothetical protein